MSYSVGQVATIARVTVRPRRQQPFRGRTVGASEGAGTLGHVRFVMAHVVAAATGKEQESEKVHTLRS